MNKSFAQTRLPIESSIFGDYIQRGTPPQQHGTNEERCVSENVLKTLERARDVNSFRNVNLHEALGGRMRGEAAGIKVEDEIKWLTLIQNTSKKYNY